MFVPLPPKFARPLLLTSPRRIYVCPPGRTPLYLSLLILYYFNAILSVPVGLVGSGCTVMPSPLPRQSAPTQHAPPIVQLFAPTECQQMPWSDHAVKCLNRCPPPLFQQHAITVVPSRSTNMRVGLPQQQPAIVMKQSRQQHRPLQIAFVVPPNDLLERANGNVQGTSSAGLGAIERTAK